MRLSDARVLIVDDEPLMLEIHGLWLKISGCGEIFTAADGEAALAILRSNDIDLMISDIRMPSMDGLALVRRMAELNVIGVRTIFVSGYSDVDNREMHALGVSAILVKPTSRLEMTEVAEQALRDVNQLWKLPMAVTPRQCIEVNLSDSEDADCFQLGRRGFSACYTGPVVLGKVAFECRFSSQKRVLAGEGYVLWHSKTDQTIGVEFAYLDVASRSWVLGQIDALSPRSLIPDLRVPDPLLAMGPVVAKLGCL